MRLKTTIFNSTLILFYTVISFNLNAQCVSGSSKANLEANDIEVFCYANGNLSSSKEFDGNSTISSGDFTMGPDWHGSIWLGGINEAGDLLLNAAEIQALGTECFWTGPSTENGSFVNPESCTDWDTIFEVSKFDITSFTDDFEDNGQIDNAIPSSIAGWPAMGNDLFFEQYGFALPLQQLAPFVDVNNDGKYDPFDGDYPDINNASKALWWILNTNGNVNSCNGSDPLNVEIHVMAYAYSSPDPILNNSIFHDITIVQKDDQVLDNAYFSYWLDLGGLCWNHLIGSLPESDYAFFYEYRDTIDQDNCVSFIGDNHQSNLIGIKQLKGPLSPRVFDNNNDLVYPEIGMEADTFIEQKVSSVKHYYRPSANTEPFETDPIIAQEFYNLMQGKWKNGQDQLVNGLPSNYAYPGNPADPKEGDFPNCLEDREEEQRVLISSGPFRMEPESRHKFSYVLTRMPIDATKCPDISELTEGFDQIETFVEESTVSSNTILPESNKVIVYPNPTDSKTTFLLEDKDDTISSVEIFDLSGRSAYQIKDIAQSQYDLSPGVLSLGTYFYLIVSDRGSVYSGKFIKQ